MKNFSFFFLLSGLILLLHSEATACSCLPPKSPAEEMKRSEAVFLGKVTAIKRHDTQSDMFRSLEVSFSVIKNWKGDSGSEQIVFTSSNSAACGYSFKEGQSYLVYANEGGESRLVTGLCTRTRGLEDAKKDIEELDKAVASSQPEAAAMPKWLADHFVYMTKQWRPLDHR